MIPPTINTHINCSNNSKSVFGAFSKQQQGALKLCCASFSVITLNDQVWIKNPNVTPSSYPTKFCGLLGLVAPIVHTTQKIFLFGSFAKSDPSHWLRHCCQYLNQCSLSPNENFTTDTSYTYISSKYLIFHI